MNKMFLPAVFIVAGSLLLTGCSQDTERQFTTEGGKASSESSKTPETVTGSTEKITSPDTALGDTSVNIGKVAEDGSFKTPTSNVVVEPPAGKPAEEQTVFKDFKTVIVNSLNKMSETGLVQSYSADGKSATYVLVKNSDSMKAAVKFDWIATPELLQTVNVFVPVIAETSLNNQGGVYSKEGNTYTVVAKTGVYKFTVTDGLITSLNVTGTDTIKFAPASYTVTYATTDASRNIADTAVLPAW